MRGFTGFRTPGGTAREQMQASLDAAPANAVREALSLFRLLGQDNYQLWLELTWPNNAQDSLTWDEIYETINKARWSGKYALLTELECTCRPDGNACPVCRAHMRLTT